MAKNGSKRWPRSVLLSYEEFTPLRHIRVTMRPPDEAQLEIHYIDGEGRFRSRLQPAKKRRVVGDGLRDGFSSNRCRPVLASSFRAELSKVSGRLFWWAFRESWTTDACRGFPRVVADSAWALVEQLTNGEVSRGRSQQTRDEVLQLTGPLELSEPPSRQALLSYAQWHGRRFVRVAVDGAGAYQIEYVRSRKHRTESQFRHGDQGGKEFFDAYARAAMREGGISGCIGNRCELLAELTLIDGDSQLRAHRASYSATCKSLPQDVASAAWDLIEEATSGTVTRPDYLTSAH